MRNEPVVHVVGARPNFMKAAPVIRALDERSIAQEIVHTGQHYDDRLSKVFFEDLSIPAPRVNLGVGSGTHAQQTAAAMVELEKALLEMTPGLTVVYGDVNSTLAGALVASKLYLPIAHVEAGLRSFDVTMPEEINRRLTDALCDLLFVTSPEGLAHLGAEGVSAERMHLVGNPMIDTLLAVRDGLDLEAVAQRFDLDPPFGVVTVHRPSNVDELERARDIVAALQRCAELTPLIIPLHPRGRENLQAAGLASSPHIRIVEPLGYLDFLALMSGASVVITDSGGIQEETTILGVPCVTLRPNTERPITITHGTNRLVEPDSLVDAVEASLSDDHVVPEDPPPLWDGNAGDRIAAVIEAWLGTR